MISGDTFRACADIVIENRRSLRNFMRTANPQVTDRSVFIDLGFAEGTGWTVFEELAPAIRGCRVILHNGDHAPPSASLHAFAELVGRVWCVNYFLDHPRIECIPIGLENRWLRTNGVVTDFKTETDAPQSSRQSRILASFKTRTNPDIRVKALEHLRLNPFADELFFHSPRAFHDAVRRYKFVASPPGNGADCHRTWEALYLGAVPIVFSDYFPDSFHHLPVLLVENFDDPRLRDESFLDVAYEELRTRSRELANASHWLQRLTVDAPGTSRP